MLSPSPVSLAQYAILTFFVSRRLPGSRIQRVLQGFFVVAFFVLVGDAMWSGLCALKWIPMFPGDAWQIIFSFGRDVLGAGLMLIMMGDLFLEKKLRFNEITWIMLFLAFEMQLFWFLWAPSPAFTDYTFAWRHGFSLDVVFTSWILGHWLMRIPIWLAVWSTFKKDKEEKKEYGN